jgi:hypothetical protein
LLRDDGLAISKRDKGKGTSPIPLFLHHPATAGWDGKIMHFTVAKVWFLPFVSGDNFASLDPFRNPQILRQKMGQNSLPAKSYTASKKAGWLKLWILLRKQLYLLVTLPQSAVAG